MTTPTLGSILLGSTDPARLREWYCTALGPTPRDDGFIDFGGVSVLIDQRDDVTQANREPGRTILNFHVDDARAVADHLNTLGVRWLVEVEQRPSGLFGTLLDPDGNCIQIIEFDAAYLAARGHRA